MLAHDCLRCVESYNWKVTCFHQNFVKLSQYEHHIQGPALRCVGYFFVPTSYTHLTYACRISQWNASNLSNRHTPASPVSDITHRQWFCFSRNISSVIPKIIHIYFLTICFWIKVYGKCLENSNLKTKSLLIAAKDQGCHSPCPSTRQAPAIASGRGRKNDRQVLQTAPRVPQGAIVQRNST